MILKEALFDRLCFYILSVILIGPSFFFYRLAIQGFDGCYVIFGLFVLIFIFSLKMALGKSFRLQLDENGFALKGILKGNDFHAWSEIERFKIDSDPHHRFHHVGWILKDTFRKQVSASSLDGVLISNFDLSTENLIEILERWRIKHSTIDPNAHSRSQ